jgi:hypothetical protein
MATITLSSIVFSPSKQEYFFKKLLPGQKILDAIFRKINSKISSLILTKLW